MKRDYHMHPNLLKKPEQGIEFIETAIKKGFDEICFTDHMPFTVTGDEHDRIPFGKVSDYCFEVRRLQTEYKEKISIRLGIEIDFHPTCIDEIENVLSQGNFDYIIGSSHLNITGFNIPMKETTQNEFAEIVLNNHLQAIESGYFDTLSHLDVYRWVFSAYPLIDDNYCYKRHLPILHKLFEALDKHNMNLEINAAPLFKKFDNLGAYPQSEILEISREYNLKYIYGSDAHRAEHIGFGYEEIKSLF